MTRSIRSLLALAALLVVPSAALAGDKDVNVTNPSIPVEVLPSIVLAEELFSYAQTGTGNSDGHSARTLVDDVLLTGALLQVWGPTPISTPQDRCTITVTVVEDYGTPQEKAVATLAFLSAMPGASESVFLSLPNVLVSAGQTLRISRLTPGGGAFCGRTFSFQGSVLD